MDKSAIMVFTLFCLTLILSVLITGTDDHQRDIDEQRHYCEMVDLHQRSNGEYGWPNFKEIDCE